MSDTAIRVQDLGKRYRIGLRTPANRTLGEILTEHLAAPFRRLHTHRTPAAADQSLIWALRDVSFEVARGEVVGIIGANGAGKSTLLKILSRITEPTTGRAELRGSVGSLLEVGTGFHPELTGRENIYLNGAILGMKRAEITARFDEIVAFAEVERFLDTPVKRYSSGMYIRLAFAVAAHLQPEILIVDEVLAVGDAAFQAKCLGVMGNVARQGRTVLFVSHNTAAIARLCQRAILLEHGQVVWDGEVQPAIDRYLLPNSNGGPTQSEGVRPGWARPFITATRIVGAGSSKAAVVPLGADLDVEMSFDCRDSAPVREPVAGLVIQRLGLGRIGAVNTRMTGAPWSRGSYRRGTLRCRIPRLPLLPGVYTLDVYLGDGSRGLDNVIGAAVFRVVSSDFYRTGHVPTANMGFICFQPQWALVPSRDSEAALCQ